MNSVSVLYDNSVLTLDKFINTVLTKSNNENCILSVHISETSLNYCIKIKNFHSKNNNFEIYYKHNFIILRISNSIYSKQVFTRIFYMNNINITKISHCYFNNTLYITVPKLFF